MILGAQLYTVRDYCKTLDDFSESLKKIADIGYKTVQVSGTCPYDGEWLDNELKKNGLTCVITHYDRNMIANNVDEVIKFHQSFRCNIIGIGHYPLAEEGIDSFVKLFKEPSEKIKESGMGLSYHNHDFEFAKTKGDKCILEELADCFPADNLFFTLDTFWAQAGGADPAKLIRDFKGRVPAIHLKDMAYNRKMLPIGEGNMNFPAIFNACEDALSKYLLVEQDNSNGENPFDCLKKSYDYCSSFGIK